MATQSVSIASMNRRLPRFPKSLRPRSPMPQPSLASRTTRCRSRHRRYSIASPVLHSRSTSTSTVKRSLEHSGTQLKTPSGTMRPAIGRAIPTPSPSMNSCISIASGSRWLKRIHRGTSMSPPNQRPGTLHIFNIASSPGQAVTIGIKGPPEASPFRGACIGPAWTPPVLSSARNSPGMITILPLPRPMK